MVLHIAKKFSTLLRRLMHGDSDRHSTNQPRESCAGLGQFHFKQQKKTPYPVTTHEKGPLYLLCQLTKNQIDMKPKRRGIFHVKKLSCWYQDTFSIISEQQRPGTSRIISKAVKRFTEQLPTNFRYNMQNAIRGICEI